MKILRVSDVHMQANGVGEPSYNGFVVYGDSGLPIAALSFETREAAESAAIKMNEIIMTCVRFDVIK